MDEHSPAERDKKKEEKKRGFAFLFWLLGGLHFAYLGKWGFQILFWGLLGIGFLTLGSKTSVFLFTSAGIWWVVELFYLPNNLHVYTAPIFRKIKEIMEGQSPVESQQAYAPIFRKKKEIMKGQSSEERERADSLIDMLQNKYYWLSKVRKREFGILLWFLGGLHFAYLGNWGRQILFWVLLGIGSFCLMMSYIVVEDEEAGTNSMIMGFLFFIPAGIWWAMELFLLEDKLHTHNEHIFRIIMQIEAKERETERARNIAMIAEAIKSAGKAGGDRNKGEADAEGE